MPRLKKPHRSEVINLPFDPGTPYAQRRAIYSRLSDDDINSVSHDVQEQDAIAWATRQNLTIVKIYRDWRTGFDANRRAYRKLFADAHKGEHTGVLVWDDTRFHRGIAGAWPAVEFHRELPTYRIDGVSKPYDIENVGIWAQMSGNEAQNTRRRSITQRRERASRGQWVAGKRPYWLERDAERRPYIVPERAEYVLEAIRRYAAGVRLGLIAQWLTAEAPHAPKRQTQTWTMDRVREMFRHPALWGRLDFSRFKIETERRNGEVFQVKRTDNPEAVPMTCPPLIHASDLERAECVALGGCERDAHTTGSHLDELIRANNLRAAGRPHELEHPLRKRTVCPCGWRMAFRQKRYKTRDADFGYLTCARTKQKGTSINHDYPDCPLKSGISTLRLWPVVRDMLIGSINNPDAVITAVESDILAAAASEARSAAEDAQTLEQAALAIEALELREETLYVDWKAGEIGKGVYDRQRAAIQNERLLHEEARRQVLDRQQILQTAAVTTATLRVALAEAGELPLAELTLAEWTGLVDRLVQDVTLNATGQPTLRWRQS